jgi:2-polyprenyl-3-methyl-5-hydroxy-6-metoxy-1,4-benzoquinol methylase
MSLPNRQQHQITDPFVLDDLRQMEFASRYNGWLYRLVQPYIGRRVLEIGPGIGNISRLVLDDVDLLVGMEPNPHCAQVLADVLGSLPAFELLTSKVEDSDWAKLGAYRFDTVLCMNVLEHVKDDQAVLAQFARVLAPGGRVVLLVPAFPQAFGPIDASVGHFRRYTKASLRAAFRSTELVIEHMLYTNMLGLLGWMVNARIRKVVKQNDTQIKVFDALVPVLSRVERIVPRPFGLSLIAAARKM